MPRILVVIALLLVSAPIKLQLLIDLQIAAALPIAPTITNEGRKCCHAHVG
jgi:hypothetical protein